MPGSEATSAEHVFKLEVNYGEQFRVMFEASCELMIPNQYGIKFVWFSPILAEIAGIMRRID